MHAILFRRLLDGVPSLARHAYHRRSPEATESTSHCLSSGCEHSGKLLTAEEPISFRRSKPSLWWP